MALDAIDNLPGGSKRMSAYDEKRAAFLAKRGGGASATGAGPGNPPAPPAYAPQGGGYAPGAAQFSGNAPPQYMQGGGARGPMGPPSSSGRDDAPPPAFMRGMDARGGGDDGPPPAFMRGMDARGAPDALDMAVSRSRPGSGDPRGMGGYGGPGSRESARGENNPYGGGGGGPGYMPSSSRDMPSGREPEYMRGGVPPYAQRDPSPRRAAAPPARSEPPFGLYEPPSSQGGGYAGGFSGAPGGRPPVAPSSNRGGEPLSSKEQYRLELQQQMADKQDRQRADDLGAGRRGRSARRDGGSDYQPPQQESSPFHQQRQEDSNNGGDARSKQLEYAAALQQQMDDNAARRGGSRGPRRDPAPEPALSEAWCGGEGDPRAARGRYGNSAKEDYAADLKRQIEDNAYRKGQPPPDSLRRDGQEWAPDRIANQQPQVNQARRPQSQDPWSGGEHAGAHSHASQLSAKEQYAMDLRQQMADKQAANGQGGRRPGPSDYQPQSQLQGMQFGNDAHQGGNRNQQGQMNAKEQYAMELRQQMADKQMRDGGARGEARRGGSSQQQQGAAPMPSGGYGIIQPPGGHSQGLW